MHGSSQATRKTFAPRPLGMQALHTHAPTAEGAWVGGTYGAKGEDKGRQRRAYVEVMRNRESVSHNREECSEKEKR